jgi:hypothetical protein
LANELVASGLPTKHFFISMLTRDIELKDAILDLLDNCLDGVMRTRKTPPQEGDFSYYNGFEANIEITNQSFCIWDNCGGIPYEIATQYAFRMGKPEEEIKENDKLPTVGIYGIGMKRAIFKIGRKAEIYSKTDAKSFCVSIPESWASKGDKDWDFPIEEKSTGLSGNGTKVVIEKLTPEPEELWKREDNLHSYEDKLRDEVALHYSFIIEKGFIIRINKKKVEPNSLKLMFSKTTFDGSRITPYLFQKEIDGVDVKIAIGFYSPIISEEEIDAENEGRRSSADAGITVICNDRVVLYNNKDYLTGWGEAGVPSYHTQFIGIRGVVVFRCDNPIKLPMTTTKRGIDLSSPIYFQVKERIREGLKIFTDYTNKWKGRTEEERKVSSQTPSVDMKELLESHQEIEKKMTVSFSARNGEFLSKPKLPLPKVEIQYHFIRFSKPSSQIEEVTKYIYGEPRPDLSPSNIGERCFDRVCEESRRGKQ